MSNAKLTMAQVVAAAALGLALIILVAGTELLLAGLIAAVGITAIALSVAAFLLLLRKKSFIVAGLLAAAGVAFMVPAIIAMGDLSAIAIPGSIFGVILAWRPSAWALQRLSRAQGRRQLSLPSPSFLAGNKVT